MKQQLWFPLVITVCVISVHAQVGRESSHPAMIEKVSATGTDKAASVDVILSRPTVPKVVKLTNPDRLVLELQNTEAGGQPHQTPVNRGGISAIRIGEEADGALRLTRVVLDLLQPLNYKVTQNGNRVTVILAEARSSTPPSTNPTVQRSAGADVGGMTGRNASSDPPPLIPEIRHGRSVRDLRSVAFGPQQDSSHPGEGSAVPQSNATVHREAADSVDPPTARPRSVEAGPTEESSATLQPITQSLNALPLQFFSRSATLAALSPTVAEPEQLHPGSELSPEGQPSDPQPLSSETNSTASAQNGTQQERSSEPTLMAADSNDVAASRRPSKIADEQLAQSTTTNDTFVIGPGDVLSISVWKEPDITRSLPVRSDGIISLPLIGEVQASGRTPRQLGEAITKSLQTYISEPEVTVIVQEIKSRTYNVLGQVTKPGSYVLSNSATVLDAIAKAGGFRDFAKKKSMYVLRRESDGKEARILFNYNNVIKGKTPEQNITLRPGDTIVVP